jgi:hypothetical protein
MLCKTLEYEFTKVYYPIHPIPTDNGRTDIEGILIAVSVQDSYKALLL